MSRESVQVVRAAYEAYLRGDVAGMLERVAPDVVVHQPPDQVDARTSVGHEGLLAIMGEWIGEWEDYRVEMLRMVDADPHVVVTIRQSGRGKGSGVEVESEYAFVYTVEAGKVAQWRMFTSEDQALQAVGVPE